MTRDQQLLHRVQGGTEHRPDGRLEQRPKARQQDGIEPIGFGELPERLSEADGGLSGYRQHDA